ncbi:MAG: homoserine O-acetyltransferase, partial [Planctomycetota bacterium]
VPETTTGPTAGGDGVGLVTQSEATLFAGDDVLATQSSRKLGPIVVRYETYGTLSPERDNAVFVCHALTGDAHAAGRYAEADRKPGWWDGFIGPGRGLDTDELFVICANVLGGCRGTTGPGSTDPETGEPFGLTLPFLTIGDMVEVHVALARHLGIDRLLGVIGGSLGGMQVLEWVARHPEMVGAAVCLATAGKLSAQGIAFNAVGRRAVTVDPNFADGRYTPETPPATGLALARMIAHITYLSEASIELKFGRKLQDGDAFGYRLRDETEFQVESYLNYQGRRFVERFDANSYLYLTRAMDYFDLAAEHGSLEHALGRTDARFLVASYTTDWLFPTEQSRELVRALLATGRDVSFLEFDSPYGHDAFLIEQELPRLASVVGPFLRATRERLAEGGRR